MSDGETAIGGTVYKGVVGTAIHATTVAIAEVAKAGNAVAKLTSASRISTANAAPPSGTL